MAAFVRALGGGQVSVVVNVSAVVQAYTAANGSAASLPAWAWAISAS